jgi:TPR repeat protein
MTVQSEEQRRESSPASAVRNAQPVSRFDSLRSRAEAGDRKAWNELGLMYLNGDGAAQDPAQAAACFHRAADLGSTTAMINLGWCYEHGQGVAENDDSARNWYELAAMRGRAEGRNRVQRLDARSQRRSEEPAQSQTADSAMGLQLFEEVAEEPQAEALFDAAGEDEPTGLRRNYFSEQEVFVVILVVVVGIIAAVKPELLSYLPFPPFKK